jgi:hypothetical protein
MCVLEDLQGVLENVPGLSREFIARLGTVLDLEEIKHDYQFPHFFLDFIVFCELTESDRAQVLSLTDQYFINRYKVVKGCFLIPYGCDFLQVLEIKSRNKPVFSVDANDLLSLKWANKSFSANFTPQAHEYLTLKLYKELFVTTCYPLASHVINGSVC